MSYKDRDRVYAWLDAGNGEKLTTLDRAVLVMIAERANTKTGVSAPGNKEPAQRWGVHSNSIDRSVARLHKLGLVDTVSRAQGQSRARYILTGEVAQPTGGATSSTQTTSSSTETTSSSTHGLSVLSKSSRSSNGVMTDDTRARATPARASDEVVGVVATTLELTETEARTWTADRLDRANGQVNNPDAYIRQALRNRKRDDKRKTETTRAAVGRCAVHWLEEPCRGCAADRKVAGTMTPAKAIVEAAAILGVKPDLDDEGDVEANVVRAGLYLGMWPSSSRGFVAVESLYDEDTPSEWPENEPQPDEPLRAFAVSTTGNHCWDYRPADAVALAGRWHKATTGGPEVDP